MQVFRANTPAAIREAFDDHVTITSLGLGAALNIPVVHNPKRGPGGWCVCTMNLLHETGWYTAQDEALGALLADWLATSLA
jgi:hypothetical protein